MKRTKNNRETASVPFSLVEKQNEDALKACFAQNSQMLLPLLEAMSQRQLKVGTAGVA
ncbi:hypothetical protein [Burkholderia cenocepacia]|uniref:hypothetical protein n=1 Tax=Burkholderia cenocepacia TaxID=95486 RepID=UPI001B9113F3|nr:hypothetical protein [Burkholderia cenocepacia]MBR7907669.1 hypothetical protein [Burkholderia cenocepacia]